MEVTFKKAHKVGIRSFKEGKHHIPDHLHGNKKFQQLVIQGDVYVHPRNETALSSLAALNESNAARAQSARRVTDLMLAAKAANAKHHEVTELLVPGTAQRLADKQAARAEKT